MKNVTQQNTMTKQNNMHEVIKKSIGESIKKIKPNISWKEDMGGFARKECENVIEQLWDIQRGKLKDVIIHSHITLAEEKIKSLSEDMKLIEEESNNGGSFHKQPFLQGKLQAKQEEINKYKQFISELKQL